MKINLTKTQVFFTALVLGLVVGNSLTDYSKRAESGEIVTKLDEVTSLLIQNKLKSNKDSVWYNNQIEKLSDLLYESREENENLRNRLGLVKNYAR